MSPVVSPTLAGAGAGLHLGPLHPAEQALVLALAFGPVLLLVLTVWISRRRSGPPDQSE
jgi:hypothetical protein